MATKTKVTKSAPKAAASKAAPKKATVKTKSRAKSQGLSHDEIARQAYMLWQQKGGSDMENWLEAERQLR